MPDQYDEKVLRAFFRDGRLVTIPAQEKKKGVILRYLVSRCFSEDRNYTEREVNESLSTYHEDVASLRRFMIVGGLLARDAGVYRRAQPGSPQDVLSASSGSGGSSSS